MRYVVGAEKCMVGPFLLSDKVRKVRPCMHFCTPIRKETHLMPFLTTHTEHDSPYALLSIL